MSTENENWRDDSSSEENSGNRFERENNYSRPSYNREGGDRPYRPRFNSESANAHSVLTAVIARIARALTLMLKVVNVHNVLMVTARLTIARVAIVRNARMVIVRPIIVKAAIVRNVLLMETTVVVTVLIVLAIIAVMVVIVHSVLLMEALLMVTVPNARVSIVVTDSVLITTTVLIVLAIIAVMVVIVHNVLMVALLMEVLLMATARSVHASIRMAEEADMVVPSSVVRRIMIRMQSTAVRNR